MNLWARVTGGWRRHMASSDVQLVLRAIDELREHTDAQMKRQDDLTTKAILMLVEDMKKHEARIAALEAQPNAALVEQLVRGLQERIDRVLNAAQDEWRARRQVIR